MPTMDAAELLASADAARLTGDVTGVRAALVAAFEAARSAGDSRLMAAAALAMPTSQGFGAHAGQLPALLHQAYEAAETPSARCGLAAALARSWVYGADAVRAARFADEAQRLAAELGTAEATADALDAALLTHWGPDDFTERISLAARLDDVAAHLTDPAARLSAHMWRLTTAWECLDLVAVQRQLRALDVLAGETGSARAAFFATSRRATLALAGGDLAAAGPLISHLAVIAAELAEPDTEAVMHSLRGMRALVADDLAALREEAAAFEAYGRSEGIPSVCAEAAVLWLAAGQPDRAGQLVAVLTAGGVAAVAHDVDFLLTVTCTVRVAAALGLGDVCREGAAALRPFAGRGVLNAGAVTFHGVVDDYLYRAHQALVSGRTSRCRCRCRHPVQGRRGARTRRPRRRRYGGSARLGRAGCLPAPAERTRRRTRRGRPARRPAGCGQAQRGTRRAAHRTAHGHRPRRPSAPHRRLRRAGPGRGAQGNRRHDRPHRAA